MATNNPLTISVDIEWFEHPEVIALREAGHTIRIGDNECFDLILSKKAWNWSDSHWPYLDIALKAARKDKPKGVKKDGKQRKSSNRKNSDGTGKVSRRGRKTKLVIGTGKVVPADQT